MSIYPNNIGGYSEDKSALQRKENFYRDSILMNQQYQSQADLDTRFYCNDQTVWNDVYGYNRDYTNKQYQFNYIRRTVDMPCGYQRNNRKSIIAVPIENSDQQTADQLTKILMWMNQKEGIGYTVSEAFQGAMISGMNMLQVWMDYREDPISGEVKVDNCSYNSFVIDPYFRKQDLSDCNGILKRSYLNRMQVLSLLPDYKDELETLSAVDTKDGKFQYLPENFNFNSSELFIYDEYYYRTYRKQKLLVDINTQETLEWEGKDKELKEFLQLYPSVKVIDSYVPTINLTVTVQDRLFYDGPQPNGLDCYTFVPVMAYYTPETPYFENRIQGLVRGLRDAQFLYNRRRVIELDILESQKNSGLVIKADTLVNPEDAYKTGQGQVLWIKKTAQMTDVQPIPPSQISPSMFQASTQLKEDIVGIAGINEENVGSAIDDKAGILARLRQGAGLTVLQRLFDQLDYSQRLLGRILIKLVQKNFIPGKVKKIIEEDPTQEFYNKNFGKYDCAVEEGYDTATQKQLQLAQMIYLREAGVPIPEESIFEASTIQNKNKIIELIKQQQQQQQQQAQAQAQAGLQEQQATIDLAHARAAADMGLAQERTSRINENQALAYERHAKARADEDKALLDKAKTLKELDSIDIQHLKEVIGVYQQLKQEHVVEQQESQLDSQELLSRLSQLNNSNIGGEEPIPEQPPGIEGL